jgi:geranyl-CoA carboxylase alpha subunit
LRTALALHRERDAARTALTVIECNERWVTLEIDGMRQRMPIGSPARTLAVHPPGNLRLEDRTHALISSQSSVSSGTLKAPMDGAIVDVLVSEGSPVSKASCWWCWRR